MDIIKLIWKNALFLAKANGLMMRVDFIPLCIIDIFSLLDAYFINVKRHHYFSWFFFWFFLPAFVHTCGLFFDSSAPQVIQCVNVCMRVDVWLSYVPYEIARISFLLWGGEGTKISLHVIKRRSNLSWVTLEPRLSSTDLKAFNKCAIFFPFAVIICSWPTWIFFIKAGS